jgi:hypothetical protein
LLKYPVFLIVMTEETVIVVSIHLLASLHYQKEMNAFPAVKNEQNSYKENEQTMEREPAHNEGAT